MRIEPRYKPDKDVVCCAIVVFANGNTGLVFALPDSTTFTNVLELSAKFEDCQVSNFTSDAVALCDVVVRGPVEDVKLLVP